MAGISAFQLAGIHQEVEIDPLAPGTIIRGALLFESVANIPFAIACLTYGREFTEMLAVDAASITPIALSFLQLVGVTTIMLSIVMWMALPNTLSAIETRKSTYYMLFYAEIIMLSLWYYQGWVLGEEASGMSKKGIQTAMMNIVPLVMFRGVALFAMPQWFGKYRIKVKKS